MAMSLAIPTREGTTECWKQEMLGLTDFKETTIDLLLDLTQELMGTPTFMTLT